MYSFEASLISNSFEPQGALRSDVLRESVTMRCARRPWHGVETRVGTFRKLPEISVGNCVHVAWECGDVRLRSSQYRVRIATRRILWHGPALTITKHFSEFWGIRSGRFAPYPRIVDSSSCCHDLFSDHQQSNPEILNISRPNDWKYLTNYF